MENINQVKIYIYPGHRLRLHCNCSTFRMFLAIFIAGSYYNDILQNLDLRIMIKNYFPLEIRNIVFHHDRYSSTLSKLGFQILMD